MAEIDPVILELQANLDRYRADLRQITSEVTTRLGLQESAVKSLEDQFRRSSSEIGGTLRGLAGAIAAAFSVQQIKEFIDNYTRLQNSLKVSGLEGQKLVEVQSELLALSKQYGVSINELADLYGKSSQAAADLGASSQQLLQVTEASAQALKITGTSAAQAGGALLGLTQALSSGIVRAEEFNQINEGGLRPLLQAAANAERFGGSISKLRAAVVDGKFTSQEFYAAILNGSQQLEGQASKAVLTLEGAFTALGSALTVYVGEAASANGATAAITAGILSLAENLDTLANVIAVIAVFMGGRYVAALAAAGAGQLAAARAAVVLSAAAAGAGTSMQVMGVRAALAGKTLLAAFGGPVGLAVTALTLGLGALAYASRDTAASLEELEGTAEGAKARLEDARQQAERAGVNIDNLKSSADRAKSSFLLLGDALGMAANKMADITNNARSAALATINLENALARKAINDISPRVQGIDSAAGRNRRFNAALGDDVTGYEGLTQSQRDNLEIDRARVAQAKATLAANKESERIIKSLPAGVYKDPSAGGGMPAAAGDGKKPKKGRKGRGASGPTAEEIEDRLTQELIGIAQQTLSARQAMATSADARAELEMRSVELAHRAALNDLEANKDYDAAQKARVKEALDKLAEEERANVERERRLQIEDERTAIAESQFGAEAEALRNQYDLAKTDDDRRAIALQILEAEDAYLRSKLEAVIANKDLTEAVRQQAQIELDALNSTAGDRRSLVLKANQGALDRYIEGMQDTKSRVEEAMVRQLQEVNEGITDALTDKLGIKNQFVKDLFSIFLDEVIFKPLAEALKGAQGGGGGGFFGSLFSSIGSIFGGGSSGGFGGGIGSAAGGGMWPWAGRASGGYVGPGHTVRVNEQRGGAEYLRMGSKGGTVIPLGQVNAMAAQPSKGGGVVRIIVEEAPGFAAKVQAISEDVAVEVTRVSAPAIAEAGANMALSRASRPRL